KLLDSVQLHNETLTSLQPGSTNGKLGAVQPSFSSQGPYTCPRTVKWNTHRFNGEHEQLVALRFTIGFSKMKICQVLAIKLNEKFGTDVDTKQIRNKVASMKKKWKLAHMLATTSVNGNLHSRALKAKILKKCHFYFDLEPLWSEDWSVDSARLDYVPSFEEVSSDRDNQRGYRREHFHEVESMPQRVKEQGLRRQPHEQKISQTNPPSELSSQLLSIVPATVMQLVEL
ncbi:hypothetical protein BGZ49_005619, partial [Haplosporangium sp. Z 27]